MLLSSNMMTAGRQRDRDNPAVIAAARAELGSGWMSVLSEAERKQFRRCMACEWHPPTMGHHRDCNFGER